MKINELEKVYTVSEIFIDSSLKPEDPGFLVIESRVFRHKKAADNRLEEIKKAWKREGCILVGGLGGPPVVKHPRVLTSFRTIDYRKNCIREKKQ